MRVLRGCESVGARVRATEDRQTAALVTWGEGFCTVLESRKQRIERRDRLRGKPRGGKWRQWHGVATSVQRESLSIGMGEQRTEHRVFASVPLKIIEHF